MGQGWIDLNTRYFLVQKLYLSSNLSKNWNILFKCRVSWSTWKQTLKCNIYLSTVFQCHVGFFCQTMVIILSNIGVATECGCSRLDHRYPTSRGMSIGWSSNLTKPFCLSPWWSPRSQVKQKQWWFIWCLYSETKIKRMRHSIDNHGRPQGRARGGPCPPPLTGQNSMFFLTFRGK